MGIYVVIREFKSMLESHWLRETHQSHWRQEADAGSLVGYKSTAGVGDTIVVRTRSLEDLHRLLKTDPYSVTGVVTRTKIMEVEDVRATAAGTRNDPITGCSADSAEFLTAHETRIAQLVVDGMTNCQIADLLRVSRRAIEQHLTRIYRKLSITRRAQLAEALYQRHRLDEPTLRPGAPSRARSARVAMAAGMGELDPRQPVRLAARRL
jgi:DNA-binding CsgD family transcriptional regulator/uncharacterized protein YciI